MEHREEKVLNLATLVFPISGSEILVAKKMKKIGRGKLNGWGGGVEPGETIVDCAQREFFEETGGSKVLPEDLKKVCIVNFHNTKSDGSVFVCTVHVFVTENWHGEILSTDEMQDPRWVDLNDLPNNSLMPADPFWIPLILSGKLFIAKAFYGPFQEELLRPVEIEYVSSLPKE